MRCHMFDNMWLPWRGQWDTSGEVYPRCSTCGTVISPGNSITIAKSARGHLDKDWSNQGVPVRLNKTGRGVP